MFLSKVTSSSPSNILLPVGIQTVQQQHPTSPLLSAFKPRDSSNNHLSSLYAPSSGQLSLQLTKQIHAYFLKTQFQDTHQLVSHYFPLYLSTLARYNILITSYNKNGAHKDAHEVYVQMRKMDIQVDSFIVPSVLKACGQLSSNKLGREVHGFALKSGLDYDVFANNALIQMYSECGCLGSARQVFDKMPVRDTVSWCSIIGGCGKYGMFGEAWGIVREMNRRLVKPSDIVMINMANLIADKADGNAAKAMHCYVIKNHETERDPSGIKLPTALIDMHSKCGNLDLARQLFDELPQKGIVSWTVIIAGYIRCNRLKEGVYLFADMITGGIFPNAITMLSLIVECGLVGAVDLGAQLHAYALRTGFSMSLQVSTALVDMYGKCGDIQSARIIFDGMKDKDVMTWTVMIFAYARAGYADDAIELFVEMRNNGTKPNQSTIVSLLSLCAESGALVFGKWIHTYIEKESLEIDMVLNTSLVDMYAKCGEMDSACELFVEAKDRDICMWNALMAGYGMHGLGERALEHFNEMERLNVKPNDITFISLLHACSHAGMVKEGKMVFRKMVEVYGLNPKIEHYGCMVDLLGRAGLLLEAYEMIENMPMKPNTVVWGALLAACKVHKEATLAEFASRKLFEMDTGKCGYNVLLSNIYALSGRWSDVAGVRTAMKNRGLKKEPGFSSIEVNGAMHEFMMGDQRHPDRKKINFMLNEMIRKLKEIGYKPDTSVVLLNVDAEEKETSLAYHSEKIAIAFGLISTAPGAPLRIVKNLRVCDDCHNATKFLSKIYRREIIVRDRNRFHHFKDGSCSCGDYW